MSMSHVQKITDFETHSASDALSWLINLAGYLSRRWKNHSYCHKVTEHHSFCLQCLGRKTELLSPRTGLPNRYFLNLLLEASYGQSWLEQFPFALTRFDIHGFPVLSRRYNRRDLETSVDFVVSSINRQMEESCDVLIQYDESRFYLASFQSSISHITKLVDDIHKGLSGLKIPYSGGTTSAQVKVDTGIVLFKTHETVVDWRTCIQLTDLCCCWARETERTQLAFYE